MSVVYDPEYIKKHRTRALHGQFEPAQALIHLLEGSGLTFRFHGATSITLFPEQKPQPSKEADQDLPIVFIQDSLGPAFAPTIEAPGIITRRVSSEDLSRQGVTTIADWARTLTQNQGTGANEGTSFLREAVTNIAYGSGLNLLGLGQRSTLVLVNGRRLAPSGSAGSYTDVMNIPLSAVDHIELISDGASTLYGADAVGGIVNFVLRGYSRPTTRISFGHLTRGDLAGDDFSQSFTAAGEHWRGIAALEYYGRNGLPASDRSQATNDLTAWGGSNFSSAYGNPGTLVDSFGRYWGLPAGQNGTSLAAANLTPTPNRYDQEAGTWILPRQARWSALVSGSYDLSDSTTISVDSVLSDRTIKTHLPPATTLLVVPSWNPFYVNPVPGNNQPINILYGFGKDLGTVTEHGAVTSGQLALNLNHTWGTNWNVQLTGTYAFDHQRETQTNLVDFRALTRYLGTTDPTTAFNPFGDGSNTNAQTLEAIRAYGTLEYRSTLRTLNLETRGEIANLPGGPMTVVTGYEFRLHGIRSSVSKGFNFAGETLNMNRERLLNATYLQTTLPVFDGEFANLKLSGGLRYEHFNDAGSASVPSLGLSVNLGSVTFVGNWARMFRPPNLPDLDETLNYAAVYSLPDPRSALGYTQALVQGGNNASLSPETARSWMSGLQFSPQWNKSLSVDLHYFNIVSFHQVAPGIPFSTNLLSDPQYADLITRDVTATALSSICRHTTFVGAFGQCESPNISAIVDLRLRSTATVNTDGFDFGGRYGLDTPIGLLSANLQGTYVLHFDEQQRANGATVSYRNTPHNPVAIRFRGVLGWENQRFRVSPAVNVEGGYTDTFSTPKRPVSSRMTWDLVMSYHGDRRLDRALSGQTTISVRGLNVFNKQPPFLNNNIGAVGFDPENADLLGRQFSLQIQYDW